MWIDPECPDERAVAGAVAVLEAGRVADSPHELPPTVASFVAEIRHGWDGEPPLAAVSRDGSGRVVGVLQLSMPERDNRHLGYVEVCVDPVARRCGVGRFLVGAAIDRLRAEGRTLLLVGGWDTPHGTAFAKALGLDAAMAEVKRRQDLRRLDMARLDRLYAEAEHAAAGYELFRMPWPIPDELMPGVVTMVAAINDAPLDALDIEDEVFSPERLRGFEAAQLAHGRRMRQLVARHKESGVLAGHTVVGVESDRPWYGDQFDT
ncbi:MAG TPA: GNAT family N-acetyltransferase, partial [Actinomycetes bacterium]|nr:GNAT family N-acetyltransferase [Actinomycetes bacterium]